MTETALQSDVFLNQRVNVETQRLRAPAHFANPTRRTHDLQSNFECHAGTSRVDDSITTETISLDRPRFCIANNHFTTIVFSG